MERSSVQSNPSSEPTTLLPIRNPVATPETTAFDRRTRWPTIDGQLGPTEEQSLIFATRFYKFGFLLLPWLWAVNCLYFWPVLRDSRSFPTLRNYVVRSAVGLTIVTIVMSTWALTFSIGGERLFGPVWNKLVMYNVADELGLTGWM